MSENQTYRYELSDLGEQFEYIYRLFFFLFSSVKAIMFFLCTVECGSIIKLIFLHKFKIFNRMISKPDESLGRKATGPVKWQPVAGNEVHCLSGSASLWWNTCICNAETA